MKILKYLTIISFSFLLFSCSEDIMDEVNVDQNNPSDMDAKNLIPDAILKTAFETTATDLAWYATVYIEHAAGTWAQSSEADRRIAQNSASLFNNNWNSIYGLMNIANTIIEKTDPDTGTEPDQYWTRAIGQILMAYNLAVATDMWGEVPYLEAFKGMDNLNPKYDKQSDLYPIIFELLDDAIDNLDEGGTVHDDMDKLFNGNSDRWKEFANALKARFYLRLVNINADYAQDALDVIPDALTDDVLYGQGDFAVAAGLANPWGEFWYWRDHLSVSTTIYDIMNDRNDPRAAYYFYPGDPAPIGTADQAQGLYAGSYYTTGWGAWGQPIVLFTVQELRFIEAEAKFRTGSADWQDALEAAVEASFDFHGATIDSYFADEVVPRLTAGNELEEIMTQKYIAMYDREAIEVYNDYRRTGFPEMQNPNNETVGFVWRLPYALSEVSSNSENVPSINVYEDKVWWAGGTEN